MKLKMMGLVFAFLLVSNGYALAEDKATAESTAQESVHKYCPVCGPEEEMEGLSVSYKYKDKKYSFCSMDCLKAFKKNPEKFIKK